MNVPGTTTSIQSPEDKVLCALEEPIKLLTKGLKQLKRESTQITERLRNFENQY